MQRTLHSFGNGVLLHEICQSGVSVLTLNRPKYRNALNRELVHALRTTFENLANDHLSQRVVVIRGSGTVFCSGHDLKEIISLDKSEYEALFQTCSDMMAMIQKLPQPVIASVQGLATAAGCQLVAACDVAIATKNARFCTPGVNIGLFCSTPAVSLARAVGRKAAMDMLLTGCEVPADDALRFGLISRVVNDDSTELLDQFVMDYASRLAAVSGTALSIGKRAFYSQVVQTDLEQAYSIAVKAMTENMLSQDAQEGISAFLQKRTPVWKHE
jgi:enoyl-CoA hydratase/carnithine racemase